MTDYSLSLASSFNPKKQLLVSYWSAQLDDQLHLLRDAVKGLTVEQLEWQPSQGVNTVGMLLAHTAVAEVYWMKVASRQVPPVPQGDEIVQSIIGIKMDDDGIPLPPAGLHPEPLRGKVIDDYLRMLDGARRATHEELLLWNDSDLEETYTRRDVSITRSWTLYHILEHFAGHFGQILLLKHLMKTSGVLREESR